MVQGQQRNNLTGRLVVRFWQIQYSALMKEWARVVLMHRDESASKPCTVRRCVLSTFLACGCFASSMDIVPRLF